jgi:hypothetical protein
MYVYYYVVYKIYFTSFIKIINNAEVCFDHKIYTRWYREYKFNLISKNL